MSEQMYDVLQVGFGPVGQANAAILGRAGRSVAVFERYPSLYGLPRAGHLDHEIMRLFQSLDIAERMEEVLVRANKYVFQNQHGEELVTFNWDQMGVSGWASDYYVYQPDLEDALVDVVRDLPQVEINQGWEAVSLEQHSDHVALTVRPRDAGSSEERIVRGRYLVAADGGNSSIRSMLGIEQEDLGFHERWVVTDYRPTQPIDFAFDNGQISDPARPMNLFQLGKKHRRFAFLVLAHEETEEMKNLDTAWRLMAPHGVTPANAEIVRHTVYTFESKIATDWRQGRCLLVGDAAHVMPPFMGQGLLSGLRDVANLGWKLPLVLNGRAPEVLLDSYMDERRPHARRLTEMSIHAGRLMVTTDPQEAADRDAAYRAGTMPPPPPFPSIDNGIVQRDDAGSPLGPAGQLSPQGVVDSGSANGRFDDVMGGGWTLLLGDLELSDALGTAQLEVLDSVGVRVVTLGEGGVNDLEGVYADYFEAYDVCAVLYRPDFYVFGGAGTAEDLVRLVDDLAQQLPLDLAAGATHKTGAPA